MIAPGLYTAQDVAELERDLAFLRACLADETDAAEVARLREWIRDDAAYLAAVRAVVAPALPMILPIGLPAPAPTNMGDTV